MSKRKNAITTRLDQYLVEAAQKQVEEWLDRAGAGRRVPPREAVENALAAFLPENRDKMEKRIVADTTARMFLDLVKMVDEFDLPLGLSVNLERGRILMHDTRSPLTSQSLLGSSDPDALRDALAAQGAEVSREGIAAPGGSGRPVLIEQGSDPPEPSLAEVAEPLGE